MARGEYDKAMSDKMKALELSPKLGEGGIYGK